MCIWHIDFTSVTAVGVFVCHSTVKWRKYLMTLRLKINLEKYVKVLHKVIKTHLDITDKFGKSSLKVCKICMDSLCWDTCSTSSLLLIGFTSDKSIGVQGSQK